MTTVHQEVGVPPWTLGWRLRRALAWKGFTAEEMASALETSPSQISRYLRDESQPKWRDLVDWARLCDVDETWLIADSVAPPPLPKARQARSGTRIHRYRYYAHAA